MRTVIAGIARQGAGGLIGKGCGEVEIERVQRSTRLSVPHDIEGVAIPSQAERAGAPLNGGLPDE